MRAPITLLKTVRFIFLISATLILGDTAGASKIVTETPANISSDSYLEQVGAEQIQSKSKSIDDAFEKLTEKTSDLFSNLDQYTLKAKISEDIDLFKGAAFGLAYKYEVEPAYIGGYYLRSDRYRASIQVNPLKYFSGSAPWLLNMNPGMEINFWQYFPKAAQARKLTNGYTPLHFPLTAEKAQKNLKPGDLAHVRANLNLNVGAAKQWDLPLHLEAEASLAYVVQAPFDIYIFKASENKVRLRLAARRDKSRRFHARVGVEDDIRILGVDVVDNRIVRWMGLRDIISDTLANSDQNVFLADYTINLDYPEVREAYDELFAKALRFKNIEVAEHPVITVMDPRKSREEAQSILVSNLTKLDEIFRQDLEQKDHSQRRVDRNFAGSNGVDGSLFHQFNFGISALFRISHSSTRRDNKMKMKIMNHDGTETEKYFFFPTWSTEKRERGFFSRHREETLRSSNMIYATDQKYIPKEFKSIGFYYDYTDKVYKNREHQSVLTHFEQVLPPEINEQMLAHLESKGLLRLENRLKNMRISARYFIDADGLKSAERFFSGKSRGETHHIIRQMIVDHLNSIPRPKANPERPEDFNYYFDCDPFYRTQSYIVREFCLDITQIADRLDTIVNTSRSPAERHKQMDVLIQNHLFREVGPAFIFNLIPPEEISGASHFEIKFYLSGQVEPVTFIYPEGNGFPDREFYELILDIQRLMNDATPDMRLEGTSDGLTTRRTHKANGH